MTEKEINLRLAELLGLDFLIQEEKIMLLEKSSLNEADEPIEFDMFDGSIRSKALCFDLIDRFCVTIHPKRTLAYRYGTTGPYARCGSHEPVYHEKLIHAVCEVVVKTYRPGDEVLK